ncbi:MAG TPA: hypothetical protein VGR65_04930 [Casimicrobiaceae bacterium]|jgi:hypothetical protein|nr:hypothetical protein [Casimicrobiaceae bacterium]
MAVTVLAYVGSFVAALLVGLVVTTTFGRLLAAMQMQIWTAAANAGSTGVSITLFAINAALFSVSFGLGLLKIVVSLAVFHFFGREPGVLMLGILIVWELIPTPADLPEFKRVLVRRSDFATALGLLIGWLAFYPSL